MSDISAIRRKASLSRKTFAAGPGRKVRDKTAVYQALADAYRKAADKIYASAQSGNQEHVSAHLCNCADRWQAKADAERLRVQSPGGQQ